MISFVSELNPRLQVVEQMVSGENLPAAQLQIAMGIPLHQMRVFMGSKWNFQDRF